MEQQAHHAALVMTELSKYEIDLVIEALDRTASRERSERASRMRRLRHRLFRERVEISLNERQHWNDLANKRRKECR
jgi:hypothetical protein